MRGVAVAVTLLELVWRSPFFGIKRRRFSVVVLQKWSELPRE